jgi:hypothetical protein
LQEEKRGIITTSTLQPTRDIVTAGIMMADTAIIGPTATKITITIATMVAITNGRGIIAIITTGHRFTTITTIITGITPLTMEDIIFQEPIRSRGSDFSLAPAAVGDIIITCETGRSHTKA